MKYMKMLAFILIGLVGIIASISIILTTAAYLIIFALAKDWLMVLVMVTLWACEMFIMCWVVEDYHGE